MKVMHAEIYVMNQNGRSSNGKDYERKHKTKAAIEGGDPSIKPLSTLIGRDLKNPGTG